MIRRGNNFGHRWCDALIVCSILPLSFFQKIWHISNEMDLILIVLYIQPSRTTCGVYKFSHGWSIQFEMINLDIQMDAWEINGNSFGHNFPKSVDTISTTGKQILRSSYLKIRLTLLDSLIIFKRICMGPIQRLYGQFWHFMITKIQLLDDLKCGRSTLSHTFSR